MQIVSAGAMAFNHGLNDGQKFMGVFALTLLAGGVTKAVRDPAVGDDGVRADDGRRHLVRRLAHHQDGRLEADADQVVAGLLGRDVGVR